MTTVGSGQTLNVSNGQVSAGVIVFSGGVLDVLSGGETTGAVVGGAEIVSSGGVASATIVSGGILAVFSGGLAIGALISGGDVYISAGGTVFTTDVEGSGNEIVVNGGAASGGDVEGANAEQTVYGFASGAILVSGGEQLVNSGGSASATTVNDGGYLLVQSGGVAAGAIISGGTFELAGGGATGTAPVTFETSAGGTLRLDDSVAFGGLIAGFGKPDYLDLSDIAFGSGTHLTFFRTPRSTSGALIVTDGVHTANLTLIGQYVTAQFTLASDGHGGTLIGDPPVTAANEPGPSTDIAKPLS
ncbi:MAG: AIDA repeat-containing protein [Roseiarcus sp.]